MNIRVVVLLSLFTALTYAKPGRPHHALRCSAEEYFGAMAYLDEVYGRQPARDTQVLPEAIIINVAFVCAVIVVFHNRQAGQFSAQNNQTCINVREIYGLSSTGRLASRL